MAKGFSGRELVIKRDDTVIGGLRTKTLTTNNEPIDTTSDDDSAARSLLAEPGEKHIDLSGEGIFKDDALVEAAIGNGGNGSLIDTWTIELPNGAEITSEFFLNSIEVEGEYQGAVELSLEAQSSGGGDNPPTFTAAPA